MTKSVTDRQTKLLSHLKYQGLMFIIEVFNFEWFNLTIPT